MTTTTEWDTAKQCQSIETNIRKAYQSIKIVLLKPKSPGDLVKMQILIHVSGDAF